MTPIITREDVHPDSGIDASRWMNGFVFVVTMWSISRLAIVTTMQLIAPLLHVSPEIHNPLPLGYVAGFVPTRNWELFSHWDGAWYRRIGTIGYDYVNDGKYHSIVFFPLFPLVTHGVMTFGLPFEVAGTLVNNIAFLGALLIAYYWVEERHGTSAARWTTAVLTLSPLTLFTVVTYSEGLFLLLSTAALRAFDKRQHTRAALWGLMATTTRVTGIALMPAFLVVAWRERRPAIAYVAGLAVGGGLLLFSAYCAVQFGDPLAFLHAQRPWRGQSLGLDWWNWWLTFKGIFTPRFTSLHNLIKVASIFGGGYLLWRSRNTLSPAAVVYGFCSLVLILAPGGIYSIDRLAYGIVSLSLAVGLLLARRPRWGYGTISLFFIVLVGFAVHFAWWKWVA